MFVKVSIVNFIVTQEALEAQQLSQVVSLERPELETQKHQLVMSIAADKKVLVEIEDKLLELLRTSGEHILDDEVLITTIEEAKRKSLEVKERVRVSEETEIQINQLRLEYRPVAIRSSILFFVTGDMANIDPMYQYSLEFFRDLVQSVITSTPRTDDRLGTLINRITYQTYLTVSRGLFEVHRSLFAFAMCSAIMRNAETLSYQEWDLFVRGPPLLENPTENPLPNLIADSRWNQLYALGRVLPSFFPMTNRVLEDLPKFSEFLTSETTDIPAEFGEGLTEFDQLLFFRTIAVDRLSKVIQAFVEEHLGVEFTRSPAFDLRQSYRDTRPATPLLFILSQGADPRDHLLRLATDLAMESRLRMRSLGQGQGPEAEKAIQGALNRGEWVYLQNCHLSLSWLPELEAIVSKFNPETAHPDFRLFLSSMPTIGFPVAILRNSIKVTNEPPRGIRAHLLRLLGTMSHDDYEACAKPRQWKKLLFGLSFFHAVIQERKKFGPLGFNKIYEWTETDFNVSVSYLRMFLNEQAAVPWEALRFLTGEIIYGGRVTDDWDRRCMMSILSRYYSENILIDGYFFARGSTYFAPPAEGLSSLLGYVDSLPFEDDHDVFAMHANAEIASRRRVSEQLVQTLQNSVGGGAMGSAGNDAILQMVHDLMERMPRLNDISAMHESLLGAAKDDENAILDPLTVVLKQEVERFKRLLKILIESMKELEKALRGLVSMSPTLENVLQCLYVNRVPESWGKYESLKPLGSWFSDLIRRIEFFNAWMRYGNPPSFWLSAFYFPQSFLTGILQRHSRVQGIPIDSLSFELEILDEEPKGFPDVGVNIHGLFFDGVRWNTEKKTLDEQELGQIYSDVPYLHLKPTNSNTMTGLGYYQCPVYITAQREGVLSTTGTSTNFVVALPLATKEPPDHWIQRGAAMLLGTPE
jgi:dynein heavy chain